MKRTASALLLVASLVISLLVAEVGLRTLGLVQPIRSGWNWSRSLLRPLQPESAKDEINEFGLRGQKIDYKPED